jgi:hypothetical protein
MPDLPPSRLVIVQGEPLPLLRNINTARCLAKGRRCRAVRMGEWTVLVHSDINDSKTLTRIHMEKCLKVMSFVRWQLRPRPVFAGTVHRCQGITLAKAVIDCRPRFWEHGRLYVAPSRVKSPADMCILLPSDLTDFALHPPVDHVVVEILEATERGEDPVLTLPARTPLMFR